MLPAAVFAEDTGGTDADKTHAVANGEFTVTPLRSSSGGGGGSTSGHFTVEFGANGGSKSDSAEKRRNQGADSSDKGRL